MRSIHSISPETRTVTVASVESTNRDNAFEPFPPTAGWSLRLPVFLCTKTMTSAEHRLYSRRSQPPGTRFISGDGFGPKGTLPPKKKI
jgi:hypothetical protein